MPFHYFFNQRVKYHIIKKKLVDKKQKKIRYINNHMLVNN